MIDDRLSAALAAASECITPAKLAAMLELSEPEVLDLIAAGELPPLAPIASVLAWTIEDLRVWLRRHEPLWDEGDADEPEWWPREPAWDPDATREPDVMAHIGEWDNSFSFRRPSRAQLDELNRKYGPELRRLLGVRDV